MEQPGFGMKLKIIVNSIDAKFNRRNAALGLTSSQAHMLAYIVRQGSAVSFQELETFFNLRHPTVTGIVQRLEEKGFLTRTVSPSDARRKILRLTEAGRMQQKNFEGGVMETEQVMQRGFSPEELEQLRSLLSRVIENLEKDGISC